jgi:polyhydroxyalkanoate synthesis regulator phasin
MTFKEALAAKEKDTYAEYQMRSARIVNWFLEQGEITEDETEEFYLDLWDAISESEDEFDEIAYDILEILRDRKSEQD